MSKLGSEFGPSVPAEAGSAGGAIGNGIAEMHRFPPESARRRCASRVARAVVALVFIALVGTNLWFLNFVRAQELRKASIETENQANLAAGQLQSVIAEVSRMLDVLAHGLRKTGVGADAMPDVEDMMRQYAAGAALVRGVFVHDVHGDLIATSAATEVPVNNASRPYFTWHRDQADPQVRVGAPLVGRITGDWSIPISRRIEDSTGAFSGVAVITLGIRQLHSVLGAVNHGAHGEFVVAYADTMLLRHPFGDGAAGTPLPDGPFRPLLQGGHWGTFEADSAADGKRRIYSYRRLAEHPMLVVVGVTKEHALAAWRTNAYFQAAWIALLSLALWMAIAYVMRSQGRRRRAEAGLREARDALGRANAQLTHLAQYDGLTGIPNRRYFDERLHSAFLQARREKRHLAIVMADVDYFKRYNDQYGHIEGDRCLQLVAGVLESVILRPEDFIARYGGEEIVLLLPETDCSGAVSVAQAARRAVRQLGLEHAASPLGCVSVSLGVAAGIPPQGSTPEQLLRLADAALYQAKRAGRNQVWPCTFDDDWPSQLVIGAE